MKQIEIFELTSTDLGHLGGPMGSEYTTSAHEGSFSTLEKAKKCAEKIYNGSRGKIKWKTEGNFTSSGDLGYIAFEIKRTKVK